ncbi:hypothetical protein GPECTOR_85g346 [Gonium pectorale]|uniref:Uncharacterized protein n=1 Tax=Gonium pectorale TaxID=33097 RepID=A0A150G162_GONPE|nr:hypothetical protein GPECTOR_85g346 [Gonium pectorale]|eukprot:KXZ43616.1 hypothetical protein GPECTOR_85g346 [Gonium pectorale]
MTGVKAAAGLLRPAAAEVVEDCAAHLQDPTKPARDILLLRANATKVRGGSGASVPSGAAGGSSSLGGSRRGVGSLLLLALPTRYRRGALGLYVTFPQQLPRPMLQQARDSVLALLEVLCPLVARKLGGGLSLELETLATATPGSYAVPRSFPAPRSALATVPSNDLPTGTPTSPAAAKGASAATAFLASAPDTALLFAVSERGRRSSRALHQAGHSARPTGRASADFAASVLAAGSAAGSGVRACSFSLQRSALSERHAHVPPTSPMPRAPVSGERASACLPRALCSGGGGSANGPASQRPRVSPLSVASGGGGGVSRPSESESGCPDDPEAKCILHFLASPSYRSRMTPGGGGSRHSLSNGASIIHVEELDPAQSGLGSQLPLLVASLQDSISSARLGTAAAAAARSPLNSG